MKNLFEREAIEEVIARIDALEASAQRQWGKMNAAQMMAHCSATLDMAAGRVNPARSFVGRLIGRFFKPILLNEKPFTRNSPTAPELVMTAEEHDFLRDRETLKAKIREFHEGGEAGCTRRPHAFFGPLTPPEWARGMYKHLDHHLRQFSA